MKNVIPQLIVFCLILFVLCNANAQSQKALDDIRTEGVLIVGSVKHFQLEEDVKILNGDNTLYTTISRGKNNEIVLKPEGGKLNIRAFYPDYDIVIFDADKKDEGYEVYVSNQVKKVDSSSHLTYMNWEDFIGEIYLRLTGDSPLKRAMDENSETIKNYKLYSYEVVCVKGDWLKVKCLKDCEGCPPDTMVEGWVKWRDKDHLLVRLFYLC